jgi:chorismate mutase
VTAWNYVPVIFSQQVDITNGFTVMPAITNLLNGESTDIDITIMDTNGNPVVGGSTIDITSPLGALSPARITTNTPGTTHYSVTLTNDLDPLNDTAQNTVVTVIVKGPNGQYSKQSVPIFLSLAAPKRVN